MQEFLECHAVVDGSNSTLVHPDVELDVGSAGIGEPQPPLHTVALGVTTLENLDVLFSQPAGDFLQSALTGEFVTNSVDALLVSLLKPNPMVLDTAGHECGVAKLFGHVEPDDPGVELGGLDEVVHPHRQVPKTRDDVHALALRTVKTM